MRNLCARCNWWLIDSGLCLRCARQSSTESCKWVSEVLVIPPDLILTDYQEKLASDIYSQIMQKRNVFVHAICGSGKTELCLKTITFYLKQGKRIVWFTPRREIVLEIHKRLSLYYKSIEIGIVCEGYQMLERQFVCATTHQAYQFQDEVDLIILDEPDAFPFANNDELQRDVLNAGRGQYILLSATLDEGLKKMTKSLMCVTIQGVLRPNYEYVPIPHLHHCLYVFPFFLAKIARYRKERCLIFVPTKKIGRIISNILRCPFVAASVLDKDGTIQQFRNRGGWLVTTTILERGVTFLDCFVFILYADHPVYSISSLTQIIGRVRRGMNPKKGACHLFFVRRSDTIIATYNYAIKMKHRAQSVLGERKR